MKLRIFSIALAAVVLAGLVFSRPKATESRIPCPVSLTNPDGQSLTLEKYDLRVAIDGPLSLTEMEMVFRNPEKRQMEGRFLYVLPTGATISRFAKEVDGKLMEGEVVEKLRAQSVYTQVLHTMRDPALLEMDQGNRFSARVFPIAAEGTVRLLLSYSQVVPIKNGERKVSIPLAGIPKIGQFSYSAVVNDVAGQKLAPIDGFDGKDTASAGRRVFVSTPLKDYAPQHDLELTFRTEPTDKANTRAITAGNYQMLSFTTPKEYTKRSEAPKDWNFYFDTSASNADMEKQTLSAIEKLLGTIDPKQMIGAATCFDVEPVKIRDWTQPAQGTSFAGPKAEEIMIRLRSRHFLGATNLEAALKHIGDAARAEQKPQNFILVSDGIATLGAREVRDLLAALGDWPDRHTLHALVIGSKQDEKTLNAIVEKGHGRVVNLALTDHVDADVPRVISELTEPLGKTYEFYDESAAWIYPKTFRDIRGETELVVFSQLKDGAKSKPGVVARAVAQKPVDTNLTTEPTTVPEFAPLLQREATAAFLNHLEQLEQTQDDAGKRAELRKQRVEISEKNRVLCPLTSLLVLESEADYARFGIQRTSLADVMTVGDSGIVMLHRTALVVPAATPAPAPAKPQDAAPKTPVSETISASMKGEMQITRNRSDAAKESNLDLEGKDSRNEARDRLLSGVGGGPGGQTSSGGGGGDAGGDGDVSAVELVDHFETFRRDPAAPAANAFAANPVAGEPRPDDAAPADRPINGLNRGGVNIPPAREAAQEQLRRVNDVQPIVAAPRGVAAAAWTQQFATPPTAAQLDALHAQVAGSPRDRNLRNLYADALFAAKKWDELQGQAFEWLPFDPENPQVYEYLGKSATGLGDKELALRAMTSIAEVAPNRAALLARAGWLLLTAEKYPMAEQMFREALKNRKDDPNLYRGLALSLWMADKYDVAAKELSEAIKVDFNGRYGDVARVLHEELGYVLRAWAQQDKSAALTFAQFHNADADMRRSDAIRVTMGWETDANDVDLHVVDPNGEECFYSHMHNASGLELYSDQTQGLGPEVIRADKMLPGTYTVGVTYFNPGPMGVSRGVVVIMKPQDGVVKHPTIVPFCLVPGAVGGANIRMVGEVKQ